MSAALSKRQQARNERTLQDLIKSVPGNNVCADCQARNPGWASWSLGVFLCMRCAALHRKMGTHITKVKSLSMDSWSNDQVENMKRVGNAASNRIYNPTNQRPPIPIDVDEADSAMERFIRAKYTERAAARNNTGSSNSNDDIPPPLPPKTGSKFGFRSASSIFPLSSSKSAPKRREPPPPVHITPRRRSPSPEHDPVKSTTGPLDLAGKMARLKDMGFTDSKRNLAVLNGLGGNLEKTINTLVRLGEGNGNLAGDSSSRGSRTPVTPAFPMSPEVNRMRDKPTPSPKNSTNPFDLLDVPPAAQPQSSQSTGSKNNFLSPTNTNPFLSPAANTNPFGLSPSQSQYNLNQAFNNMAVSDNQAVQPLFPNHTGGFPQTQPSQVQQLYQQSMTPPVPSVPQQFYNNSNMYTTAPQQAQNNSYNPFMQQQVQPVQQAPAVSTNFQSNPYTQQQLYSSPVEQAPPQQFPPSVFDQGAQQQAQNLPQAQQGYNPFFTQNNAQSQISQPSAPQFQQAYGFANPQSQYQLHMGAQTYPLPTQPVKANNQSILDLFNYPQLAPTKPQQENQAIAQEQAQPQFQNFTPAPPQLQKPTLTNQASAQVTASRNPFQNAGGNHVQAQGQGRDLLGSMGTFPTAQHNSGARHVSQESMSIDVGGWQNGRHSPDAWGTISARAVR